MEYEYVYGCGVWRWRSIIQSPHFTIRHIEALININVTCYFCDRPLSPKDVPGQHLKTGYDHFLPHFPKSSFAL
jgi:predicted transglutaminase-like protease